MLRTTDGGSTWEEIQVEQPTEDWSPLRQYVLALSPSFPTDRTIFTGNRHGQVFRSTQGGDEGSWEEVAPVEGRVRIASPYRLRAGRFDHVFVGSLQDGEFPRRRRKKAEAKPSANGKLPSYGAGSTG